MVFYADPAQRFRASYIEVFDFDISEVDSFRNSTKFGCHHLPLLMFATGLHAVH